MNSDSINHLLDEDFDNLRHMTGAESRYPKTQWGYRNHFAPAGSNIASMERLEAAGYVRRGRKYHDTHFFHATKQGCRAIGMKPYQIANALGE